jgi:hypothetical protein
MKQLILLCMILFSSPVFALSSRQEIVQALFRSVENWMGSPYELGGEEKTGVDCSGFVVMVYDRVFQMKLPRRVRDQKVLGVEVSGKFQPGDLLFFDTVGGVSHVGIYVFDNKFIHAASGGQRTGVIKSSLTENYYKKRFLFARRLVELPPWKKQEEADVIRNLDRQVIQGKADLVLGSQMMQGKIIPLKGKMKPGDYLYFQIRNGESHYSQINLEILSSENRYFFAADLTQKPYVGRVRLPRGEYTLRLTDNSLSIISESRILVN